MERALAPAHATVIGGVRRLLDLPLESISRREWRGVLDRIGREDG